MDKLNIRIPHDTLIFIGDGRKALSSCAMGQ